MRLVVYHVNQDDPKKCTAKKMERFGFVKIVKRVEKIPRRAIILDPSSNILFSRKDREISNRYGIVAVDCSWEEVDRIFSRFSKFPNRRSLPFLIPVNPINFGKPSRLSTLEAFISSLYIIGEDQIVNKLSNLYKWSANFVEINKKYLYLYKECKDSNEIKERLKEIL